MIVRLTAEQIRFIVERTKEEYPFEACGLLLGDMNEEKAVVRKVLSTRNVLRSSTEFQIDPEEFLRGLSEAGGY